MNPLHISIALSKIRSYHITCIFEYRQYYNQIDGYFIACIPLSVKDLSNNWEKQLSKREDEILQKTGYKLGLPEPERIIAVLVEIIQRQQVQLQPQQLSRRLSRKGIKISTSEIDAISLHYQLTKKKRLTS